MRGKTGCKVGRRSMPIEAGARALWDHLYGAGTYDMVSKEERAEARQAVTHTIAAMQAEEYRVVAEQRADLIPLIESMYEICGRDPDEVWPPIAVDLRHSKEEADLRSIRRAMVYYLRRYPRPPATWAEIRTLLRPGCDQKLTFTKMDEQAPHDVGAVAMVRQFATKHGRESLI